MVRAGEWVSGEEFLRSWGRQTLELLKLINSDVRRRELKELISRIRETALEYGYGPARVLVSVFKK